MYQGPPIAPVDAFALPLEPGTCTRCSWSAGPRACLQADGQPGGLLVVGETPIKGAARPFASPTGAHVRGLVEKYWQGPVAYDYAIKCSAPGKAKSKDAAKPIKECRPFLTSVIDTVQPMRVLAVGSWAILGLLGRSPDMDSIRRGYGWIRGGVPVFYVEDSLKALQNKFIRKRYEEDVKWALTVAAPTPSHLDGIVHVVDTVDDAEAAYERINEYDEIVFDVETAGIPHGEDFTVLCAGVAVMDTLESDAWVWSEQGLREPAARAILRRLLETKLVAGSNIKYDAIAAEQCLGIDIKRVSLDTQIVHKLAEPTSMGRLDYASELVGMGGSKEEAQIALKKAIAHTRLKKERPGNKPHSHWCSQAIRAGAPGGTAMNYAYGLIPDNVLWRYNGRDVLASATVALHLRERTERTAPHEMKLWDSLMRPAIRSFKRIERVGIQADRQGFESFSASLHIGLDELREGFKTYGKDFNPNSPDQVAKVLFKDLGFKPSEMTAGGKPSTDKSVLEHMRGLHPFVDQILEFRRLEKLDGTYAAGMIEHILSDGRIHPTFRLDGTETMRISSENPNGQNIPRAETREGKMARDGFIASPGRILVELDQSQIELRVAAGMSGDPEMIAIYKSNLDYHLRTAQLISKVVWNKTEDAVGEFERSYSKTVNFGLLYGKTDYGLSQQLGCSVQEAAAVRQAILGRFKKLAAMIKRMLYNVRSTGHVEIPWFDGAHHVRPLLEVGGHDDYKKQNAENSSINTPIQGRAAMYTVAAIPKIHDWIDDNCVPAEIVNTVHDSIILDVEPEAVDEVIENSTRIMTSFDCWGVPLVVDAKAGDRWGSLRKIKHGERFADAQVRWAAEALRASSL